jgi:tetrahydromethanopterin S-methyltransferase subunit E
MYNTNAYLDDSKPLMRILAMHKIQFVILTFRTSQSHYRLTRSYAQIMRALFVPVATHGKVYTIVLVSLRRGTIRDCVNFTDFAFGLNVTLISVFNFTVLLSYRAIRVFLI